MKVSRVMIAAPKSGSGKTVVTCALLCALKNAGRRVSSYKCGPDYIDPMFHEKVIGVPAKNLDTFFTDEYQTRKLFLNSVVESGVAVLEGVMGLFDGLGGIREEGSSYHLAKVTGTPIVFVVDAKGMGRSVIPLIAGFLKFDKEQLVRGVILNRMSKGYYNILKPLIEKELDVPVVGFLPEREELHIESRHLGLILPDELKDLKAKLQTASEEVLKTVSIEDVMKIAESAEEIETVGEKAADGKEAVGEVAADGKEAVGEVAADGKETVGEIAADAKEAGEYSSIGCVGTGSSLKARIRKEDRPVIAVAKDEAFCFYYADNILILKENGAEIKYFSPLHDEKLPEDCHALLLGGGYPELYARELSENSQMHTSIRQAVKRGMPVVAECGGFMYLHSAIIDKEGISHSMAGIIPATCFSSGKLVRFGYIELQEKQSNFLPEGEKIKGHEFHYYDSVNNGEDVIAIKPATGREYSCIIDGENHWMGFPHLYYPSNPAFAKRFVEKAENYKREIQTYNMSCMVKGKMPYST